MPNSNTHTASWQMSNEELVKSQFSDVLKWIYVVLFLFDFSGLSPSKDTGSEATAQNIKEVSEWCPMCDCDCAMIHAITGSFLMQDHILGCQQPHANQSVNAYFFTKNLWLPGGVTDTSLVHCVQGINSFLATTAPCSNNSNQNTHESRVTATSSAECSCKHWLIESSPK